MKKFSQIILIVGSLTLIGANCQVTPTNENISNNTNIQVNSAPEYLTYTNDTYKFTLQYPSTWTIEESSNNEEYNGSTQILSIYQPDYRYISFSITQVSEFSELKTLIEQSDVLPDGTSLAQISEEEVVLIDGRSVTKAEQATALGIPEDIYYVELENGNYLFISAHQLDDNLVEEEIINSLRFTGDWLTYTSEDLGFNFQYPPEYQLTASSEGLYLDQGNGQGVKFYFQPYDLALDYDTMLYSKSSLLRLKNNIANEENVEVYNDIPVAVGFNYDVPGAGFYRGAYFFVGNDLVQVSMGLEPQNITYPNHEYNDEVRNWSADVISQLDQGDLLSSNDMERVRIFDQVMRTLTEERAAYTNQDYGFSFNYPKSWTLHEKDSNTASVVVQGQNRKGFQWTLDGKPVLGIYPEGGFDTSIPVTTQKEYELNGKTIFEYSSETANLLFVGEPVNISDSSFRIEFYLGEDEEELMERIKKEIIISNPGWTLYSNEDLGLRFMYPKEWNLTHAQNGTDFVDRLDNNNIFEHQLVNIDIRWSSRHEDIVSESGLVDKSLDQWLDCSNTYEEQVSCGSAVIDGVGMIKRAGKVEPPFGDSYIALAFKQDDFTVLIDVRSLLREVSSEEPGNDNLDGLEYIEELIETIRVE